MALTTRVTNDYPSWTKGSGWVMYDSNTKVKLDSNIGNDDLVTDELERSFVLANKAKEAHLTVAVYRDDDPHDEPFIAQEIILVKPDLTEVTLAYEEEGVAWSNMVTSLEIASYLNVGGTYKLRLKGYVQSGFVFPSTYYVVTAHYGSVLLEADTDLPAQVTGVSAHAESITSVHVAWSAASGADTYTVYYKKTTDTVWSYVSSISALEKIVTSLESATMYDFKVVGVNGCGEGPASSEVEMRPLGTITQNLSDTVTPTENFAYNRVVERTFIETTTPTESFGTQIVSTTPTSSVVMVCGYTGSKVYTFESSLISGYYDTPEIHFGYPDKDKTLVEIRFGSESESPHSILVYVSTNGGSTWTLVGSDTTGLGKTGFVYPWLTSNRFLVRFSGSGLHLYFYEVYAIPSGWKIKTS